jgi:hypothetical protein
MEAGHESTNYTDEEEDGKEKERERETEYSSSMHACIPKLTFSLKTAS